MNENEKLISVIDAATQLTMRKQTLFKIIKRLGLSTVKQRNSTHRNQMISYIAKSDLALIVRTASAKPEPKEGEETPSSFQADHGVFYLIQLEPEHDPGRFKVGFASNMPERLRNHRCSAPFAEIVDTWRCHKLWEKTAIDCVTQDCDRLHTEIYRTKDIAKVKAMCDQFFSLMPSPDKAKEDPNFAFT